MVNYEELIMMLQQCCYHFLKYNKGISVSKLYQKVQPVSELSFSLHGVLNI